jgi:hypothetical protein
MLSEAKHLASNVEAILDMNVASTCQPDPSLRSG